MSDANTADSRVENKRADAPNRDDVVVTLMSTALEKLRIMSYEKDIKRKSFVSYCPIQFAYLTTSASVQFKMFLELICYLMKQSDQDFVVDKYDDPNTSVNKLILSLKSMGFPLDFPASKLKLGYGEAVCAAIDFLCDKALEARNFTWTRPTYPKEDFADEAEVDVDAEVETTDEIDVEDDEDLYSNVVNKVESREESQQQMIISEVDPLLWKAELERVGPRLRIQAKDASGQEWHSHIERARKQETIIQDIVPEATGQLKQIRQLLVETLQRMESKEKAINIQFEQTREEYHQLKERLIAMTERCRQESQNVNVMTKEHADITEQLRDTKTIIDERGNKLTDTTPLVDIKRALKALQTEIQDFDLKVGVVSHTLLQAKSKQLTRASRQKKREWDEPVEYEQSDEDSS
uniref:Intraflagellar Transport Protein 57 putative n=1 Tax=Albugo laibachii Nc14 TaxID=890382 RepID=F0W1A9_9STRA|nr:Intraflagellar Transport Protein 57 putative [Albugo laibachii Nc14]|eukprot:CCA14836.1 Intraflagellar Transport Protein 57 putative [Albugo laibachii Nc14]